MLRLRLKSHQMSGLFIALIIQIDALVELFYVP